MRSPIAADAAWSASISSASARSDAVSCERSGELLVLGRREIVRRADELIAHVARLRGAGRDHRGLALDACAQHLGLRAGGFHLRLRRRHLLRDPPVLVADLVHVLHLVERVLHVARAEEDVERRGRVRLVDVDEATLERRDRRPVLLLEEGVALRLEREERVQRVETPLVQREVGLERLQAERDVADSSLQRADPRGEVGDLVAQCLLVSLLLRQPTLQARDLSVDLVLLRHVVAERRRRDDEQDEECERESPHSGRFAAAGPYSCGPGSGICG